MTKLNNFMITLLLIPSYALMYTLQLAENLKHAYYHLEKINHIHYTDPDSYFVLYYKSDN